MGVVFHRAPIDPSAPSPFERRVAGDDFELALEKDPRELDEDLRELDEDRKELYEHPVDLYEHRIDLYEHRSDLDDHSRELCRRSPGFERRRWVDKVRRCGRFRSSWEGERGRWTVCKTPTCPL